jgi:hypothetical protein
MKRPLILGVGVLVGALAMVRGETLVAQGRGGQAAAPPPQTAQQAALIDLTGYWVSVVDEDWRFRMMTPPKGDYAQVPLNAAARKIADEFNPELYGGDRYQTAQIIDCRAYGGAGLMHMPMRLHITWDSPNVLKIDTDWGVQTRLIHFTPGKPNGDIEQALRNGEIGGGHQPPSMQGYSIAAWEQPYRFNQTTFQRGVVGRGGGLGQNRAGEVQPGGSLGVMTTDLAPGWLRRNGVPYSAKTRLIEHFMTFHDPTGKEWFTDTTEVLDSEYLNTPFFISSEFQREPDGSKWAPHPCKEVK